METHRCNRECRRHGCTPKTLPPTKTQGGAAPVTSSLPLYYLDQNQSLATVYSATQQQCELMKAAGRGRYITHGKAFQLCELAPAPRNPYACSESPDSSASISVSEMKANVGEPGETPGADLPRHIMVRAQQKLYTIGHHEDGSYDSKAPLAFGAPSWPVTGSASKASRDAAV